MSKTKSLTLGARTLNFYVICGKVVGDKRWSTTQVHGGGGGGYVHNGSGYTSSVHISSTSTVHDQIFIEQDDGSERVIELANTDVGVRPGHRLTAAFAIFEDKERGPYLFVHNHTTHKTAWFNKDIDRLAISPPFKYWTQEEWQRNGIFVGGIVMCFIKWWIGAAMVGYSLISYSKKAKARKQQITDILNTLLPTT